MKYFEYGEREISYLKRKDARLGRVIDSVGRLYEPVEDDLYSSLVRNIIGQQIAVPLYERLWAEFRGRYGDMPDPYAVIRSGKEGVASMGLTFRKAEYIVGISEGFADGSIDAGAIFAMEDMEAFRALDSIRGVGPWTAEMAMLFCLKRPDVFSYGDLALIRGLRMIYGREEIGRACFERLRKRFSPYGSIASFYIWEVGEGRVPGYADPAKQQRKP